jgi:hypothetical protein
MARRTDTAAAKQARQKKIAIGGFVVLIAVLAISVPRTLKMMHGSGTAATPAAAAAPATPATPATGTPAAPAAPVADANAQLVDTGVPPEAGEGQLTTFERFESKDPFAQQAQPVTAAAAPAAPRSTPAPVEIPAAPVATTPQPTTPASAAPAAPAPTPTPPPPPPPPPPPAPAPAPKPTSAVIAVNGVRETVALKAAFPAADKVFELRSIGTNEIKVGIAGGSLTGGAQAVTLKKGKKVTLVNTADGTRYELVLVSLA